jgi:hypothetical protein
MLAIGLLNPGHCHCMVAIVIMPMLSGQKAFPAYIVRQLKEEANLTKIIKMVLDTIGIV